MTFSRFVEWDIGLGGAALEGNERNSGVSFTLPFRFYVWRHFGLSFRPTWSAIDSRSINDYDLGLSVGIRYVSVKAGYRWVKVGSASLNGPFAGLSFYY